MRASLPFKRSPWLARSGSAQSRCQQAVTTCSKIDLANVAAGLSAGVAPTASVSTSADPASDSS
jgi:hypothetical protein